ncbi:MAG TPA: hypothetical protein VIM70_07275 [Clostridium sp.]|uniref:hypothetical protein n=1 Tax=Clostridium sp. TaxID=1506 RepID=UPI002F94FA91
MMNIKVIMNNGTEYCQSQNNYLDIRSFIEDNLIGTNFDNGMTKVDFDGKTVYLNPINVSSIVEL